MSTPPSLAERLELIGINHPEKRAVILSQQAVNIVLRYLDDHTADDDTGSVEALTSLGVTGTFNRQVWMRLLGEKAFPDFSGWEGPDQPHPDSLDDADPDVAELAAGMGVSYSTAKGWLDVGDALQRPPHWYDQGGMLPVGWTRIENTTGRPEPVGHGEVDTSQVEVGAEADALNEAWQAEADAIRAAWRECLADANEARSIGRSLQRAIWRLRWWKALNDIYGCWGRLRATLDRA